MHVSCIIFLVLNLKPTEVTNKRVIEIGSYDVNGGVRSIVESFAPSEYLGVDIEMGPGVDVICSAEEVLDRFGKNSFDVVISTETIEHVYDWKKAIDNFKMICRPGGIIILTTRSYGFVYHPTPMDLWRFQLDDMKQIFSDFNIINLENDTENPGVFVKVRKNNNFCKKDISNYELYSMVVDKRIKMLKSGDFRNLRYLKLELKEKIGNFIFKKILKW